MNERDQNEIAANADASERFTDAGIDRPVRYRIDPSKITFQEFRFGATFSNAVFSWLLVRTLGSPFPGSTDDPPVELLEDFTVEETGLPEETRLALKPMRDELEALGFHSPTFTYVDDFQHSTKTCLATFAHRSVRAVGRVHLRTWRPGKRVFEFAFFEFITAFEDGTFLWSLSSKQDMLIPEVCQTVRAEKASAAELYRLHTAELAKASRLRALPAFTSGEAMAIAQRLHETVRDDFLERGVFVQEESIAGQPASRVSESRYPEVMAELEKLERRTTSWRAAIVILVFSLLIFMGIGFPGQVSFLRLLALVPILLFHEAGHYLAMRWFGYRNLKMFFIPGFGAAVSGRHYNVAGWKKVVVSLMGPVPGIVLGIAIGACGIYWRSQLAMEAAMLLLALNAFNLIPILPLDGGHVVRTIIFARHYWLDIGFRAIAAAIVTGFGVFARSTILILVGVSMFLGIPQALRVAKLSKELREEGFEPVSQDSNTIPPDVADAIIDRLKERDPKPAHPKLIATRTVNIFETLNARPPGWFASFGLLAVHVLSMAAAVMFAMILMVAQRGPLSDFVRRATESPKHAISSGDAVLTAGAVPTSADQSALSATFKDRQAAVEAFEAMKNEKSSDRSIVLFGDTILITMPTTELPVQVRELTRLRGLGAEVGLSNSMKLAFRLTAIAPSTEKAAVVTEGLNNYFDLYGPESLTAPWSSTRLTPEQLRVRRTFVKLTSMDFSDDPELKKLEEELAKFDDEKETPESKALQERYNKLTREFEIKSARSLSMNPSLDIDRELVAEYLKIAERSVGENFREHFAEVAAPRLGVADPNVDLTASSSGFAMQSGTHVDISNLYFDHIADGARALVGWLESNGFRDIRYDLHDWGTAEMLLDRRGDSTSTPPAGASPPK